MTSVEEKPVAPVKKQEPRQRRLRLWPAVMLLVIMWSLPLIAAQVDTVSMVALMVRFMGPAVCGILLVAWWAFFSRAPLMARMIGIVGLAALFAATVFLSHSSIQGFGSFTFALPWGMTAFAVGVICSWPFTVRQRTLIALFVALLGFGYWSLVRMDGVWGDFQASLSWRWQPTAEDRFLQDLASRPDAPASTEAAVGELPAQPEWPGFRGPHRDAIQPGVVLEEDWIANPPRQVWRIQVGPGWSSFAVAGERLFTQEQRGDDEAVVCYHAGTGAELWAHQYASRFFEAVGGAGPRATPTLSDGNLYALGANGILKRLDPLSGNALWQRDLQSDAARQPPTWGFASSPLVWGNQVIVHAGGAGDKGVLAYDCQTGEPLWSAPAGDHSYSSPQLFNIDGTDSVLILTNQGLTFLDPADGSVRGNHEWKFEGYRVVQPLQVDGNGFLLGTTMGTGTRRIDVQLQGGPFSAQERWTSRGMSPAFNDYVAHQGYLYGFDNTIFACIDLETGQRQWKKGRYGNGQVLLLPDADQLLVSSESGEIILLHATPERLDERARFQALEGKTWNHPVLIGKRLYIRNGEQAACFELP